MTLSVQIYKKHTVAMTLLNTNHMKAGDNQSHKNNNFIIMEEGRMWWGPWIPGIQCTGVLLGKEVKFT